MLIVLAVIQLNDVYPLAIFQKFQETQAVDQEGFATIFLPENKEISESIQPHSTFTLMPDRIVIKIIGLDAPVVISKTIKVTIDGKEMTQFLVPEEFAAGWHETSAPLGEIGNTVISGHHNAFGKVFEKLVNLKIDDEITLRNEEKEFTYKVVRKLNLPEKDQPLEVRLENANWILPSDDERITLVTCWPKFSNTNRLIIVGVPVENEDD